MKFNTLAVALILVPLSAFAGKAERDFVSTKVQPAIQEMTDAVKKSCGCAISFDAKIDTFKDTDELGQIRNFANAIKEKAPGYCSDAPSKAAVCKLKTIEFSRAASPTFKFSSGKGIATSDSSSYPSWDMVVREIDK
ncbi:MAG: hypothetical protein V4858_02385 [Pseudomonadota bacterium]